jgi:hypothetical protein
MSKVLHEWEMSLKDAYPNIWANYRGIFQEYTNQFELSEGLEKFTGKKTMLEWMKESGVLKYLASIQQGDDNQNGSPAFNQAKQDYLAGWVSIQQGDDNQNGSSAFNQAKQDYQTRRDAMLVDAPTPTH